MPAVHHDRPGFVDTVDRLLVCDTSVRCAIIWAGQRQRGRHISRGLIDEYWCVAWCVRASRASVHVGLIAAHSPVLQAPGPTLSVWCVHGVLRQIVGPVQARRLRTPCSERCQGANRTCGHWAAGRPRSATLLRFGESAGRGRLPHALTVACRSGTAYALCSHANERSALSVCDCAAMFGAHARLLNPLSQKPTRWCLGFWRHTPPRCSATTAP